jgi:glutamate synthase domain-containing protein 3
MGEGLKTFDCAGQTTREINTFLKESARMGPEAEVVLLNPDSRHNLAVGLTTPLRLNIEGPVGYYCAGLCEGVNVRISGDAGWGLGENLMSGRVQLSESAGSSAGATMRGGTLIVGGNAGARCGVAMKGGTLIVGGDVGYMTGFMMQKGVMIIGGDTGEALGDSLYEGRIYVRGRIQALGSDAVQAELTDDDIALLSSALADAGLDMTPADFQKIVSGKRLYNFDKNEKEIWKTAL